MDDDVQPPKDLKVLRVLNDLNVPKDLKDSNDLNNLILSLFQKGSFEVAKGFLLSRERAPFRQRKGSFRNAKGTLSDFRRNQPIFLFVHNSCVEGYC